MNNSICWKRFIAGGILLLAFTGLSCTKPSLPVQYHTLSPVPPALASVAQVHDLPLPLVLVGPVRVSSFLKQGPLVKQNSSHSASLLEQHHWAGDLDEILTRIIIQNLSLDLGHEKIYLYPESSPAVGIRLEVSFFHFEKDVEGKAYMEAKWNIIQNSDQSILHSSTIKCRIQPGDAGYDALAEGLSQGLSEMCNAIAASIMKLQSKQEIQP